MCAARQGEILDHAASMLAPGGEMGIFHLVPCPRRRMGRYGSGLP